MIYPAAKVTYQRFDYTRVTFPHLAPEQSNGYVDLTVMYAVASKNANMLHFCANLKNSPSLSCSTLWEITIAKLCDLTLVP
jgi:hypothetical protein